MAFASPANVSDTGKNTAVSAPWQAASAKKSVDSTISGLRDIGLLNAAPAPVIPGLSGRAVETAIRFNHDPSVHACAMSDGQHCRHCGRPLAPAAQFCGGCGIPVAAEEALTAGSPGADIQTMAIPTTDAGPADPDDPYYWEPRRRILPWIAAGLAVALITGGIIVAAGS